MLKPRLAPAVLALASSALAVAGCGEGASDPAGPASLTPPRSLLFIEATIQPEGKLKSDVESVAREVGGVDLGELLVSELEDMARDEGEKLDFAEEVEPWLGETGAIFFESYERGDFTDFGIVVSSTDVAATEAFIDDQFENSDDPVEEGSYEGIDYWVDGDNDTVTGLIGDFLVGAESKQVFERIVDVSSNGGSLAEQTEYEGAAAAAIDGSFADVYLDLGRLIQQSKGEIDEKDRQVLQALRDVGLNLDGTTALASILPGSNQIEVQIGSNLGDREALVGEASELLGALPGDAFAAIALTGFGEQLREGLDELDREGIPGSVPPGELKSGLKEVGVDLEALVGSLRDAGVFALGDSESSLGGALVFTTEGSQATDAIASLGMLLRGADVPGVTALGGGLSGFSVRDPEELGPEPLVLAARGDLIAIGYGVPATVRGLAKGGGTLSEDPAYDDAVASLDEKTILGFADGPAALRLADALIPSSDEDFESLKPYLRKVRFLALGSGSGSDPATATLIAGLEE